MAALSSATSTEAVIYTITIRPPSGCKARADLVSNRENSLPPHGHWLNDRLERKPAIAVCDHANTRQTRHAANQTRGRPVTLHTLMMPASITTTTSTSSHESPPDAPPNSCGLVNAVTAGHGGGELRPHPFPKRSPTVDKPPHYLYRAP